MTITVLTDAQYRARAHILRDVENELDRQNMLWGTPVTQDQTPERRLAILAEEFGEYAREVLERNPDRAYEELIQVAAVAIANAQRIEAGLDRGMA